MMNALTMVNNVRALPTKTSSSRQIEPENSPEGSAEPFSHKLVVIPCLAQ